MSYEVVVTGSRRGADQDVVNDGLDAWVEAYGTIGCVVHGACPDPLRSDEGLSVDACAERWAQARGIDVHRFPVSPEQWRTIGCAAGPLRNGRMGDHLLVQRLGRSKVLSKRVGVLAFPGGSGTASMRREGVARRLPVFEADPADGAWRLVNPMPPMPSPPVAQGAVSLRVDTAVALLRGRVLSLGPLRLPPPGLDAEAGVTRQAVEPGQLLALHCRRAEIGGGAFEAERRLRFNLRGRIFAVAQLGHLGAIDGLWPIPAVHTRGQPAPWRLTVTVAAAVNGHLGRMRRRAEAEARGVA